MIPTSAVTWTFTCLECRRELCRICDAVFEAAIVDPPKRIEARAFDTPPSLCMACALLPNWYRDADLAHGVDRDHQPDVVL